MVEGIVGAVLFVGAIIYVFKQVFAHEAKIKADVLARATDHKAVIQDIISMQGHYDQIKLFLRIETPQGPIGEYLIVPLKRPSTMEFLQDARATQRPILVRCCVDRSIEYAYRQHATVVGLA